MTIHARFLPKYPKDVRVKDGLTKTEANGVLTLGFDYATSEFGAELQQAVDSANSDAAQTAADRIATDADKTAAQTAATEAQSWANLAETAVVNIDASFDLVADAQAATIGATKKTILTQGFTTIGRGGARYKRVATQPAHPGKLRSTDRFLPDGTTDATNGGWWEMAEPIVDARMLGVVAGSNADTTMANAIAAAAGIGSPLYIPVGTYQFAAAVVLTPLAGNSILLGGKAVFDFTSATDVGGFTGGGHVYIDGGALVQLPDLSANVAFADSSLTFASNPSLKNGDRILIFNPTGSSYSAWNATYFAGEMPVVQDGSGGTAVKLFGTTFAAYSAAAVDIYKHPNKRINVSGGKITIIESLAAGFGETAGFKADRIADSDLSAFQPTQSMYAGMALKQCVGIYGTGYKSAMVFPSGGGTCYGLIYGNCQDIYIEGEFDGGRHGVAGGGYGDVGSVPSRNVHIRGTARNSPDALPSLGAVEFHGNCEFCSFTGRMEGGVTLGGNHNSVHGDISTRPSQNGLAVYFAEMVGTSFKVSGRIVTSSGGTDVPAVSIGDLGSSPLGPNTLYGGVLDFSDVVFDCPLNTRLMTVQNYGANPSNPIILDVRGAKWLRSATTPSQSIIVSIQSGSRGVDYALMEGFINGPNAPYAMVAGVGKVRGWRRTGSVTLTPSTSASVATSTASINAPKKPNVSLSDSPVTMGGARAYAYVDSSTTATSVVIGMATCDGNSFPSSAGGTLGFTASLDE
jgi:hypothetical protein